VGTMNLLLVMPAPRLTDPLFRQAGIDLDAP
jgi:hypothetical protein